MASLESSEVVARGEAVADVATIVADERAIPLFVLVSAIARWRSWARSATKSTGTMVNGFPTVRGEEDGR